MPRFEELIARAQSRGFGMLLGRSLDFLANIEFFSGRLMCAQEHAQRAAEVLEECGADPTRIAFAWGECGNFSYYQGEWERAREWIERAKADMAKADPTGTAWRAGYPHIWNGKLRIAYGCARQGVTSLEDALAIATANEDLQALRHANSVLAESELVEGRAEAAYARLEPLLDRPELREPDVTMRLLALAAWAELALGHVEAAEARVRECLERSAPGQCYFARPDARRVEALLAMKQGRWQDAAAALEEAISVAHAMPYPYAEAKALMVYGELEAARGEPEAGRRRFGTALDILSRLGERVYAKHIEQAMAALPLT